MQGIHEIFEMQPAEFWFHEQSGKYRVAVASPAQNILQISLSGEIGNEAVEFLWQRNTWAREVIQEKGEAFRIYLIIDASGLEFIDIEARQRIFNIFQELKFIQHVWVFSNNRWTQSYWRVVENLIPALEMKLVNDRAEALRMAVDAQGESLRGKVSTGKDAFDWHWKEHLHTRFFDRYLLKYVQLEGWVMKWDEPNFSASFFWLEPNILLIEMKGNVTEAYAKAFFHKKIEIVFFLQWNGVKEISIVLNNVGVKKVSSKVNAVFKQYLSEQPVAVTRFILGASLVERVALTLFFRFVSPQRDAVVFPHNLADAIRKVKGFEQATTRIKRQKKNLDKYYLFLKKKQNALYRNDERFRRKLFSHLSQLIGQNELQPINPTFSNTYLGNEIFHALELLAADFRLAHSRLEKENIQLYQLRSSTLQQQLNPHFIFNVLNSILANLYEKNFSVADRLLTIFSHLIRTVIENSHNEMISLDVEIDFIEKYIEMEQVRAQNAFSLKLEIDPKLKANIYNTLLTPMLIQPFIEQAVWHRLMPSKEKRELTVRFEKFIEAVRCSIIDNGIGLKQSMQTNNGKYDTSGTKNVRDRIMLLNSLSAQKIKTVEQDLDEGGSMIQLYIPSRVR